MYKLAAKNLLNFERLDVALKIKYIEEYLDGRSENYKKLYIKSIKLRTAFIEDDKHKERDFIDAFNRLIESVKSIGFQEESYITVSKINGLNITGAHRLACAVYFEKDVYVDYINEVGLPWDENWFNKHGFGEGEINLLKYTVLKYSAKYNSLILWPPVINNKLKVEDVIEKYYDKSRYVEIQLNQEFQSHDFQELVKDIYAIDYGVNASSIIEDKAYELSKYKDKRLVLYAIDSNDQKKLCKMKNEIREQGCFDLIGKYNICHTSDSISTALSTFSYLMSDKNMTRLKQRAIPSSQLSKWLYELELKLENLEIEKHSVCIVGSSTMDLLGIRGSTDVDFIIETSIRGRLFDDNSTPLTENLDLAANGYLKLWGGNKSDSYVIHDFNEYFHYRGFKFIDIDNIQQRKSKQCRKKDINDLQLIYDWKKNEYKTKFSLIKLRYNIINNIRYYISIIKICLKSHLPTSVVKLIVMLKSKFRNESAF